MSVFLHTPNLNTLNPKPLLVASIFLGPGHKSSKEDNLIFELLLPGGAGYLEFLGLGFGAFGFETGNFGLWSLGFPIPNALMVCWESRNWV